MSSNSPCCAANNRRSRAASDAEHLTLPAPTSNTIVLPKDVYGIGGARSKCTEVMVIARLQRCSPDSFSKPWSNAAMAFLSRALSQPPHPRRTKHQRAIKASNITRRARAAAQDLEGLIGGAMEVAAAQALLAQLHALGAELPKPPTMNIRIAMETASPSTS